MSTIRIAQQHEKQLNQYHFPYVKDMLLENYNSVFQIRVVIVSESHCTQQDLPPVKWI